MSWEPPQPTQPPPPGSWPPPQQQAPWGPGPPTNSKATTSLVLGICGIVLCPVVLSIPALIFGYQAKREIDSGTGATGGRGMAVAGIVLGWIGLVLGLLILAFFALALSVEPGWLDDNNSFSVGPNDQVD